jgi:hypothetical protein
MYRSRQSTMTSSMILASARRSGFRLLTALLWRMYSLASFLRICSFDIVSGSISQSSSGEAVCFAAGGIPPLILNHKNHFLNISGNDKLFKLGYLDLLDVSRFFDDLFITQYPPPRVLNCHVMTDARKRVIYFRHDPLVFIITIGNC